MAMTGSRSGTTRGDRGQALLELALGMRVFVTVLVFGVHFAEVSYLSLKVQEANASSVWDATAYKMHNLGNPSDFAPLNNLITSDTASRGQERYKDMDGRATANGSEVYTQVFTQAKAVKVSCGASTAVQFEPHAVTNEALQNVGGMECSAEAELTPWRFPMSFAERPDSGGIFNTRHTRMTTMRICSTGRALGGSCGGKLGVLLDEWALTGEAESKDCDVAAKETCENKAFYGAAKKVFENNGAAQGDEGTAFCNRMLSTPPPEYNENDFFLSLVGGDKDFVQKTPDGPGDTEWPTTPGGTKDFHSEYRGLYGRRGECFLGKSCT
jgi:hypothetical protein